MWRATHHRLQLPLSHRSCVILLGGHRLCSLQSLPAVHPQLMMAV
jgi:hypothetical protein